MIPTTFGAIFIIFPKRMHSKVTIIIGLVVTVAPTLGGYITETISWHFMFLLNVIPGIFVCMIVFWYVDFNKSNCNLLQNFDFLGILLMTLSLDSLQYILEEGNKKDCYKIIIYYSFPYWLLLLSCGCYLNSFLIADAAHRELFIPQMVRGEGRFGTDVLLYTDQ